MYRISGYVYKETINAVKDRSIMALRDIYE